MLVFVTWPYLAIFAQSLLQRMVFLTPVSVMGLMLHSCWLSSMAAILTLATLLSLVTPSIFFLAASDTSTLVTTSIPLAALDTSSSLAALGTSTSLLAALNTLTPLLAALDTSISLAALGTLSSLAALDASSSLAALDSFPSSVRILQRVSSESESLPPESVWIFLAVTLFLAQSLDAAKCPVFLQALHDLPVAKQLSPPVHFQMPHFSQPFFLAVSDLSFLA